MKYKYKIQYTLFVLLLCAGFGTILNAEFDRVTAADAVADANAASAISSTGSTTPRIVAVKQTTRSQKIIRLIAPGESLGSRPTEAEAPTQTSDQSTASASSTSNPLSATNAGSSSAATSSMNSSSAAGTGSSNSSANGSSPASSSAPAGSTANSSASPASGSSNGSGSSSSLLQNLLGN